MVKKVLCNEKKTISAACLLVLLSRCLLIYFMDGPFVYADEMGYWSHAANMAGLQWSIEGTSWYSFGYSFFLVPLFWISHNMYVIYKLALFLNAIASVISFLVCYDISKKLSPGTHRSVLAAISVVVIMYPSFLAQSYIAWSETILYMCIWILFWLMLKLEERQSIGLSLLLGFVLGFIYMIHNRTIGILIAYCIIGFASLLLKKTGWKYYAAGLGVMAIMMAVSKWFRTLTLVKYVKNFDSPSVSGNGIGAVIGEVRAFSPMEAFKALFLSVSGQVWYLLAATGLLVFWGSILCIRQMRDKKYSLFGGFALLSLAGTLGISGIWWMKLANVSNQGSVRVDGLFYGRYNESILGIFLLLGLLYLVQMKIEKKNLILLLSGSLLLFMTGLILSKQLGNIEAFYVQSCSVFALEYYRWFGQFQPMLCTGTAFGLALMLFLGIGSRKDSGQKGMYGRIAVCGICVIFWGLTGLQGTRSFTMVEQRYTKQYQELFDYMRNLQADKIYVYGTYKEAADIQTRIVDSEVIRLLEDPAGIRENEYLVLEEATAAQLDMSQFEKHCQVLNYILFQKTEE